MGRVIPNLSVHREATLPDATVHEGQFRRNVAGLWWSDGVEWRRVDAPGVFWPITQADYDELGPEEQDDPAILWVIVNDPSLLRPTTTWVEVEEAPGSPDPGALYVVNP